MDKLYGRHDFFEKVNILKYSNDIPSDSNINNINRSKLNFNKNSNRKYYYHICKTKGHSSDFCKFNSLTKENNKINKE